MRNIIIVIATGNEHKMQEYRHLFSQLPNVTIKSLKDENIHCEIEETGETFEENAIIKANEVSKYTKEIILADDSGLEVDALNGFPGIYSARFMKDKPYPEKWSALIERLKPYPNKEAQFHCVLALKNVKDKTLIFEGIERGHIVESIHGLNGFGYDPIFYSNTLQKTYGEATESEKNLCSHRGRAFQKLLAFLKEYTK